MGSPRPLHHHPCSLVWNIRAGKDSPAKGLARTLREKERNPRPIPSSPLPAKKVTNAVSFLLAEMRGRDALCKLRKINPNSPITTELFGFFYYAFLHSDAYSVAVCSGTPPVKSQGIRSKASSSAKPISDAVFSMRRVWVPLVRVRWISA